MIADNLGAIVLIVLLLLLVYGALEDHPHEKLDEDSE